jgi:hypothetical protein
MKYIFFIALIVICGCTSTYHYPSNYEEFKVISIDYKLRDELYIFLLENSTGNKLILFSDKTNNLIENIPFKNYKELLPETKCNIEIYPDSNKYVFKPEGIDSRLSYPYEIYIENYLYIKNDTVVVNIYRSHQIYDKYLEIK